MAALIECRDAAGNVRARHRASETLTNPEILDRFGLRHSRYRVFVVRETEGGEWAEINKSEA